MASMNSFSLDLATPASATTLLTEGREGEVSLKVVERGGEGLQTAHLLHKRFTMSTLPTAVA